MDLKHKKIYNQIHKCYDELQYYEAKLEELREQCEHPETEKGLYSWRPGVTEERELCKICGEPVDIPEWATIETSGLPDNLKGIEFLND